MCSEVFVRVVSDGLEVSSFTAFSVRSMFSFIDVHNHMYSPELSEDIDQVVERAKQAGVQHCVVVAENETNCQSILDLVTRFPDFCLAGFGVHPVQGDEGGEARSANMADVDKILPWMDKYHENLVCIGECGLDFTPRFVHDEGDKESQRTVLKAQVEMSKKYDLPLNVHSRSAGRPTISLLKEADAQNVLLHAFDGKASNAMEGVQQGYYFSIPPSIIRSGQKQKLVERIPLENLILETDCPALGPEKQVRNEPANIRLSCEYIAKIKKTDMETVAKITWNNTLRLFPRIKRFLHK